MSQQVPGAPPSKEGLLTKCGGVFKTWKSRLCSLNNNVLYYYDTENVVRDEHKGSINLENLDPSVVHIGDEKFNEFRISTRQRVYFFRARSFDDRDSWIAALRDSITYFAAAKKRNFSIGDHVVAGGIASGIVRFVGETQFAEGAWLGIELSEPYGKNDGSVQGVRYFHCKPQYGLFISPLRCVPVEPPAAAPQTVPSADVAAEPEHAPKPSVPSLRCTMLHTLEHDADILTLGLCEELLVTGTMNGTLCVWSAASGDLVSTWKPTREIAYHVEVSAGFDAVAVAAETDMLLLDGATGEIRTKGAATDTRCCCFLPDHHQAVFGGLNQLGVYTTSDLSHPVIHMSQHVTESVFSCAANEELVFVCDRNSLLVVDIRKPSQLLFHTPLGPYPSVTVHGSVVATADVDVNFWDMQTLQKIGHIPLKSKHLECIYGFQSYVAVGDAAGKLMLFDVASRECVLDRQDHSSRVRGTVFDEQYICSGGTDRKAFVLQYQEEF